jgi:hypothetical protein
MQTFILSPARWRTVRALGRNPLVRVSDRLEAMVVVLAIATSLIAAPVAAAVGTAVYDARSRASADAAHTRHTLPAMVTRIEANAEKTNRFAVDTIVHTRWHAHGITHIDTLTWHRPVKAGDQVDIWVDSRDRRVSPPPSSSQAAVEAVCVAAPVWLGVVAAAAALVALLRWQLNRLHDAAWEREIISLADNDDGRTNTQR